MVGRLSRWRLPVLPLIGLSRVRLSLACVLAVLATGCGPPESAIPAQVRVVRKENRIELDLPVCNDGVFEFKISFEDGLIRILGAEKPRTGPRVIELVIDDKTISSLRFADETELSLKDPEREGQISGTSAIVEIGILADSGFVRFDPNSAPVLEGTTYTVVGSELRPGDPSDADLLAATCG